jgi:hypothetical protein
MTAIGANAQDSTYNVDYMVSVGRSSECRGDYAVAVGAYSLAYDSTVSLGYQACGSSNTSVASRNVFVGRAAGRNSGGEDQSVFVGSNCGEGDNVAKITGAYNTGVGAYALYPLSSGAYNVAQGRQALYSLTSGSDNTAIGYLAGGAQSTSDDNTFLGYGAGYYNPSLTTTNAVTTGSNLTIIGHTAMASSATATNEITLGNTAVTTLRCNTQTISSLSDERDKTDIQDCSYGLDFINAMRPVTFTWNRRDGTLPGQKQVGFIAQELYDVEVDFSSTEYTKMVSWSNPSKLEAAPMNSYPILIKAVQEMSAKITELEARLATLETE